MSRGRPLTVLQSVPPPRRTTNPYLTQLFDALPPDVRMRPFSWRAALTSRYDVLHVHWPENLLRGSTPARTLSRRLRFALLLVRLLVVRRTALVRTLHNLAPHEQPSVVERLLLRWCDQRTTLFIRLNERTPAPTGAPVETIPHGHYRQWYAGHPRPAPVQGRLLLFGLLRPYKGVEGLLAAFADLPDDDARLHLVGNPASADFAELVEAAARRDPRITTRLEYVDEDVLAEEIGRAELVVLPYRQLHNSGAALLALSLDRPVLLPAVPVAADLARETGPGWVTTFTGDVTADALSQALRTVRAPRSAVPRLSGRDWDEVGARHADAYRAAVARARRRRTRRA